jgi:hypothetical protein
VADHLEEASETLLQYLISAEERNFSCDTKNSVRCDDHIATRYSFESATALLAVRNTQNENVKDEEEEEQEEEAAEE